MNKTIKINKDLFGSNKVKKSAKKQPKQHINSTSLKKQLLKRIKEHKQSRNKEIKEQEKKNTTSENTKSETKTIANENNEFNDSMQYLSTLAKNKKDKTMKKARNIQDKYVTPEVNLGIPPELTSKTPSIDTNKHPRIQLEVPTHNSMPATSRITIDTNRDSSENTHSKPNHMNSIPTYGCLKNGRLPTYKTWKKKQSTSSQTAPPPIKILNDNNEKLNNKPIPMTYREMRLQQIKDKARNNISSSEPPPTNIHRKEKKIKNKTIKNNHKLGRVGNEILVLIKNQKTRKQHDDLKRDYEKVKLPDMKNELKKSGLLSSGSTAPPDVIREIYTSSKLAGNIENKNDNNLLDSFLTFN